jgi:cullin 3
MIAKLKAECGHQFTSRLEGMFKDMDLSNSIMKAWKQGQQEQQQQQQQQSGPLVCDLSVSVLTSGFWPLPAVPPCLLPLEAQVVTDRFRHFYLSQHSGRKLIWQTSLGSAELRCSFDGGKKELVVHPYQMCILMLFNSGDKLAFAEIEQRTRIPPDELTRQLAQRSAARCTPGPAAPAARASAAPNIGRRPTSGAVSPADRPAPAAPACP